MEDFDRLGTLKATPLALVDFEIVEEKPSSFSIKL